LFYQPPPWNGPFHMQHYRKRYPSSHPIGAIKKTNRTVRKDKHPPDNMHALKNIYLFGHCRRSKQKKQTRAKLKEIKKEPFKRN
jgi:hypothetical protein